MRGDDFASVRRQLAAKAPGLAELTRCAQTLGRLAQEAEREGQPVRRVALAGDLTLDLLAHAVVCAIAQEGELARVHTAPFGAMRQECLQATSALHAFRPEVVVLVPDWRSAVEPGAPDAPAPGVDAAIAARVQEFDALWSALEAAGCRIVQHLFVPPHRRHRGVAERRLAGSARCQVQSLNDALLAAGEGRVTFIEADRLAESVGLDAWSAPRYFHTARLGADPRFLTDYLPWFRGAWRSATGRAKKALVLDLDDTLWGGVIGDDGVDGIVLGPDHGLRGEAFAEWQRYLAALRARGVVLAVCSRNDPDVAASGLAHPHGALRRDDFAAFACGWGDKAAGLQRIARELSLGLDALVFVDDNPAERLRVAQAWPEVSVVDLGTDPAGFIDRFEAGHWFDAQGYTEADFQRGAAYAARAAAQAASESVADIDTYLRSLDMVGTLAPARPADLARLAQLEDKTNQFNLTTRRRTRAELESLIAQPGCTVLCLQLRDRFGDHGLVSAMVAVREADTLRIDSWVMSCRVFARTAEHFMLAALAQTAQAQGASVLVGEYVATARNGVVADLYARLGFAPACDAGRWWRADASGAAARAVSFIRAAPVA